MAALHVAGKASALGDEESPASMFTSEHRRGGWNTVPFLIVSIAGLTVSAGGWMINIIVFLIMEFNFEKIDAAQIANFVNGCMFFCPVIAAVLADSCLGCFSLIFVSSLISLMGLMLLVLTVTVESLRPPKCDSTSTTSSCSTPSPSQYAFLYTALALATIGLGGTRFTLATMGANQFENQKDQAAYFSWYFIAFFIALVISATGIVYVEDNVSWSWGFGVCIVVGALSIAIFLSGSRFYRRDKPQGSPFASLARVVVASVRKRKAGFISSDQTASRYYYGGDEVVIKDEGEAPSASFRFLNRAALMTEEDVINPNGSIAKPWNLCTVQQVEDLKTIIRIFPVWSTTICISIPIATQASLSVIQALTMDRHVSPRFQIPPASMPVFALISTPICVALLDRVLWPTWRNFTGRDATPLQKIGLGHLFNVAAMAVSAIVEVQRRSSFYSNHLQGSEIVPMSVLWLVPQLALVGIGEAFHFPGQVALYYQEFPTSLKNMATAIVSLQIGIGFCLSTAVIGYVRKRTEWLPENLNHGKLDNMYWVLVVLGSLNFCYYLLCSWWFKYKKVDEQVAE